ncbi:hypothetical protein [Tenacibaculum aquimarinum]|uniref:hypothetical protein n=1 Tax=Tenacibaculum aquimarinum TaxID=2910675 RepID=UPI001F0ACE5C|nr:hypothetical protein [Tenacibaculum aquimarinum]MCH3884770.1 hypothetical protein [Tenacibaculum aquimarinum]
MKLKTLFLFFFISFLNNNLFCFQEQLLNKSFDSIYKEVNVYRKKKENTKALMYSRKLLNRALENKNKSQEARSYYKIAEFQRKLKVKDSAFYYYKKSKELYLQENDSIQVARCLLNIAIIESDFGDYPNSDISGINSLKYLNGRRKKPLYLLIIL